ncbi:MAG: HIRAN domain-containing protein [Flavobacteriales bacterium]|jgi:hypothetical protein|nr:HIRAN domain-containing protein [Flavobacteriales bacterium]
MDRLTFLRSMLGNAALLTLPPLEILSPEAQDRLDWTREANLIFVFDAYVRGFQYHDGQRLLPRIKDLDPLDLVREYDNQHDANAVAVYWEGHKLGYLPMGENVSPAYMMDHGMLLECSVVYTQPKARAWEQCFIAVHLLLPSTPSFDAYLDHYMDRDDAGYKRRPEYGGEVEARPEADPPLADDRPRKQAAGLQLFGEFRFVRLLRHLQGSDPLRPYAVDDLLAKAEAEGLSALGPAFREGGYVLEVRPMGTDAFDVSFGHRDRRTGEGAGWNVVSNAKHEIERTTRTGSWSS